MFKGIPIRILSQSGNFVSFVITDSNSRKRLKKTDFVNKVKTGVYQVDSAQPVRLG